MKLWCLPLLCAVLCPAQNAGLAPDLILLAKIKTRMAATLRSQPNYTCVQEIERSQRRVPRHRFEMVDMLRLEVALIDGTEVFAWPGARKFEDTELRHMVTSGAIGNGDFALHARAVFTSDGPVFTYRGDEITGGRPAIRYDYRVTLLSSGYHIRVDQAEAVVAYHGSFWADPETYDLRRLEIVAEDIPPSLRLQSSRTQMDYARMRIGSGEFLLPAASEMSMIDRAGNESRNRVRFTGCRQYTGDSVVSFDRTADETEVARPPAEAAPEDVPPDLVADIRLDTEIDSEKSMVGDPVSAVLVSPVRQNHHELIPKGTTLLGRIKRLEHHRDECAFEIEFDEARGKTGHWNLLARVQEIHWPRFPDMLDRRFTQPSTQPVPRLGTMYVRGSKLHLPRGSRMTVRTEDMMAER